ncbi:hypothetical protein GCM10008938_09130 [Deinococcus roseus]|uniref:Peptidase C39-like domain-containing protein n=2 Tax=Deinococcus roseus TaxID=392414 RepID=A0ABQ2CVQ9_9DEIO|nr:hypothetical protein GCM10008938_09130 [Deinococcus roseus]
MLTGAAFAAPEKVFLTGVRHEYQRLNNCGPVTLGMALSYYGSALTQYQIAPILKPNKADKNVSPDEMRNFVRKQGFKIHEGIAGNSGTLKSLLAAGYPVMVQTWMELPEEGGMGHYRLLLGFDDEAGVFRAYDSYMGTRVSHSYARFDQDWQVFNRTYLVVYPESKASDVKAILGPRMNGGWVLKKALQLAQQETSTDPRNAFAWFNLGSTLVKLHSPKAAIKAFDRSRNLGLPWRMFWYQFEPLEAYFETGRYSDVVSLSTDVLKHAPDHEEALYWRGRARYQLKQPNQARTDVQKALQYRPAFKEARDILKIWASRG